MTDFIDFTEGVIETSTLKQAPWMQKVEMVLVRDEAMLKQVIDECIASGRYGIDVEATGLDDRVLDGRTVDIIAGLGLAPTVNKGYYIPVRHGKKLPDGGRDYKAFVNIPVDVFRREFNRLVQSDSVGVFHGGKYDHNMLQFDGSRMLGEWDKSSTWDDTLLLAYLNDSRAKRRGLKFLSSEMLDLEMITIVELFKAKFGDKYQGPYDFSLLDPEWEPSIWYATSDVIITRRLYDYLAPKVLAPSDGPDQTFIYKIEKKCLSATRWMRGNRVYFDQEAVAELIQVANEDYFNAMAEVYERASTILGRDASPTYFRLLRGDYADDPRARDLEFRADDIHVHVVDQVDRAKSFCKTYYPNPGFDPDEQAYPPVYDISSNPQLGKLFEEMKVPGLNYTPKSGQVKTTKDELKRIVEEYGEKFPFLKKVKLFRESRRALSNYLLPMLNDVGEDGTGVINFNAQGTDTGRFSTPKDKDARKMDGFVGLNLQALPAKYDKERPESMKRLRETIKPRPAPDGRKRFMVAIDFSGVELRLVTNLSGEPKWIAQFFRCDGCGHEFYRGDGTKTPDPPPPFCPTCGSDKIGDLHTLTGLSIYGSDARSKDNWDKLRGNAKACNFALCYGGGGQAVCRATGCSDNEGWRIKRKFDKTYDYLKLWWDEQAKFVKANGYVLTACGRKYPIPDAQLPKTPENKMWIAKALRNAVNGPIQGTSADVTKIAMALVFGEFKKRGWLDKAKMLITMHDELVFEVDADILQEFISATVDIMTSNKLVLSRRWNVPLTVDVEIGETWAVPWDYTKILHKKKPVPAELEFLFNPKDDPWDGSVVKESSPTPGDSSPSTATGDGDESSPLPKGDLQRGSDYVFQLRMPLTPSIARKVAEVITLTENRGTRKLVLLDRAGQRLEGWADEPIQVNEQAFHILAQERRLC
jgi:DNA polymerase I-like protein with 3'-5' exonuclease and polymerase domains